MKFSIEAVDFEDEVRFRRMLTCDKAYSCLFDISQELIRLIKYEDENTDKLYELGKGVFLAELQTKFFKILEEHDINLDRDYT